MHLESNYGIWRHTEWAFGGILNGHLEAYLMGIWRHT